MSYLARPSDFVSCAADHAAAPMAAPRRGVLRRLLAGLAESREKQAEREVARYLERTGGRLTDDIERQIMDRLTRGSWSR